ncbi:hypothetical protein E4U21_007714 [Claviceps maximensis]|nr:hypothetical protein E4U21_007714 [Claviceps maximensis]
MSEKATLRWKFQAIPGFFANHAEIARQCADGKLVTQSKLGWALLPREHPTDTASPSSLDVRDWEGALLTQSTRFCTLLAMGLATIIRSMQKWEPEHGILVVRNDGLSLPQTIYTSPLARCLQTTDHVFSGLMKANHASFQPIVKEHLRERFLLHTCDFRRPRSWIEKKTPSYIVEDNVTERDGFSGQTRGETPEEHYARKQQALEEIFSTEDNVFISLTIHSLPSALFYTCTM